MNLFVGSALMLTAILMPCFYSQSRVAEVVDSAGPGLSELETGLVHRPAADITPRRFPYDLGKKDITSKYFLASVNMTNVTAYPSDIINL